MCLGRTLPSSPSCGKTTIHPVKCIIVLPIRSVPKSPAMSMYESLQWPSFKCSWSCIQQSRLSHCHVVCLLIVIHHLMNMLLPSIDVYFKRAEPAIEMSACAAVTLIATRAVVARRTLRIIKSPLEKSLPPLATTSTY